MKKQLLYLIPLGLLVLNFMSLAIYKDKIDISADNAVNRKETDAVTPKLEPSHWKTLEYSVSFSFTLEEPLSDSVNKHPSNEPLHTNANFRGFPVAAYFSKEKGNTEGGMSASGVSWLWAPLDLALILISFWLIFRLNRR